MFSLHWLRAVLNWPSLVLLAVSSATAGSLPLRYEAPPHEYWQRPLEDAFSRWWREKAEDFRSQPPAASEVDAVRRVLKALDIPESSQMLVFSATSLQRTIGPHRPRALYFNDEVYLGWVPGGRLEIAADDPVMGPVFFILSLTRGGGLGEPDRQARCLNCHGNGDTGNLPALLADSVMPDEAGGSLQRFRESDTGHQVPLDRRFGGWHVTDAPPLAVPLANLIGSSFGGVDRRVPNPAGERFDLSRYPRPSSALLPQLIHEHQVGGVNRLTAAQYRARELEKADGSPSTSETDAELDDLAAKITRYFLFADEAPLPPEGVPAAPEFTRDFSANRRADKEGRSLKDLELKSRLFMHRCSYLIYTPLWRHLPAVVKDRAWKSLHAALAVPTPSPHGSHLPPAERVAIRQILTATCDDRPAWWDAE